MRVFSVLISGSRSWKNVVFLRRVIGAVHLIHPTAKFILGDCPTGADRIAKECCIQSCLSYWEFEADWKRLGRRAGPVRNSQMIMNGKPDLVLLFHDDLKHSRGTGDVAEKVADIRIPAVVYQENETWRELERGFQRAT